MTKTASSVNAWGQMQGILSYLSPHRDPPRARDSVLSWRVPISLLMHRIGPAAGE